MDAKQYKIRRERMNVKMFGRIQRACQINVLCWKIKGLKPQCGKSQEVSHKYIFIDQLLLINRLLPVWENVPWEVDRTTSRETGRSQSELSEAELELSRNCLSAIPL